MKSIIITLLLLPITIIAMGVPTPNSVSTFYNDMRRLSTVSDINSAEDISRSMRSCFFGGQEVSSSGLSVPNDFKFFDYDKKYPSHSDDKLNTTTYVNKLVEYIYKDRVMSVTYDILKSENAGSQPDYNNRRLSVSNSIIATCVKKIYTLNGVKKIFNDTVYTDFNSGKISYFSNGYGQGKDDINSLKVKASLAYYRGRYYDAYKCYEQIIEIQPRDDDALYRLGLMTYYQQGCYFSKKKYAHEKGKEFMEKARNASKWDSPISKKAEAVLFHWEYPNA